jgi:hypothetical protein
VIAHRAALLTGAIALPSGALLGCDSPSSDQTVASNAPTVVNSPATETEPIPAPESSVPAPPHTFAIQGEDATPAKIAACCADVQGESAKVTPQKKLIYTAALQICKTLMDVPTAGGGLASVRGVLKDVTVPKSCE